MRIALFLTIILTAIGCNVQSGAEVPAIEQTAFDSDILVTQPSPTETALPVPTATSPATTLPIIEPAPEIANDVWLNSEPMRLSDLRGKVVLVEFWTFGCINCQRVVPYINEWYTQFAGEEFEVIGVHYPEFAYERDVDNVAAAIERMAIEYPIAIDNDRQTWAAYRQRYWPTRYLIDKGGNIRYKHIGEGAYDETARLIAALIAEE